MDSTTPARVLGIGELLWDLFPDGRRLGGAPFNVTANLRRLGHQGAFLTAVGDDELGREAVRAAEDRGVETSFMGVSSDLPTGTVAVVPDGRGGHRFEIGSPAAYESLSLVEDAAARVQAWGPDAVVFGTLAQRFPAPLALTRRIVAGQPTTALYDMNLRDGCWSPSLLLDLLPLATVVKVNEPEAEVLGGILGCEPMPATLGERLTRDLGIASVCVTRGRAGAALWADGQLHQVDGIAVAVVDTVGAGDAFAAGLLHGTLVGMAPAERLAFANRLGALVASRPGALPAWRTEDLA